MVFVKSFVSFVWISFGLGTIPYSILATAYERTLIFKEPLPDKALPGHVIRTERVPDEGSCRVKCYLEPNCVSINVGPGTEGQLTCELNNHTDESLSHTSLEERKHYIHYAVENFCHGDPCPVEVSICQVGFTSKSYRCVCHEGYITSGDHGQCEDIDECRNSPCNNGGTCINRDGGFECSCGDEWTGTYCETGKIIICEDNRGTIMCSGGRKITILFANYGRLDTHTCPFTTPGHQGRTDCSASTSEERLREHCQGETSCDFTPNNRFFRQDPCGGIYKYLLVEYRCEN